MKLCKVEGCDKEAGKGSDYCRYHQVENSRKRNDVGKVAASFVGIIVTAATVISKFNRKNK